ncbi:hypothetical protein BI032_gp075 [Citrobacter phage vB_CfrM_CfP1]|jgi:hypothetical protein|uniref:Uncharacterized protein n=1 Tax=Citrobacter phage vB_CfrM_CfP1 TaxID=1871313 RepID=A0A1B1IXU9_9CAUD|nr:hypothetical protein BI032_gp075 [Citrobacter phage vB_CfrM_CfP1]ANS06141.1 hypothetical protein ABCD_0075 [Citrobacter phage vB_CfrM_CfP1]QPX73063.1 hypothetical protein [Citrobacter phage vB_Cfr_Xman]
MAKSIQSIIADTVSKSKKLFDKGDILEAPARIDVMTAMIIDAHQGKLKSRADEVMAYVVQFEDVCKYAKGVDPLVQEIYRKQF